MASKISIQPPVLDLLLYSGDGISFKLICTNDAEPPEPMNYPLVRSKLRFVVDRLSEASRYS